MAKFLGIESTCDETAAAIVENGQTIISQTIASSAEIHERYGGVFPELACRRHIDAIIPVIDETLKKAHLNGSDLDGIAVARGPGLVGALLIGLHAAKGLAIAWKKPLIGINHTEAHLMAAMMDEKPLFPALGFVLSGGHTLMLKVLEPGSYQLIGTTVDDAVGEAFDKVASLFGLPYPGGPHLEKLALGGDPSKYRFSLSHVKKNPFAFSFSGLKTAVLYTVQKAQKTDYSDIAAAFQKTAINDLIQKARLAMQTFACQSMIFGGGVTNNQALRKSFQEQFPSIPLFWPRNDLSSDNAAMIAALAYYKNHLDPLDIEAQPASHFWQLEPLPL